MRTQVFVASMAAVVAMVGCADTDQRDDAISSLRTSGLYTDDQAVCIVDTVDDLADLDVLDPNRSASAGDLAVLATARRACVGGIDTAFESFGDPTIEEMGDLLDDEAVEGSRIAYVEALVVDGGLDRDVAECVATTLEDELGVAVFLPDVRTSNDTSQAERDAVAACG